MLLLVTILGALASLVQAADKCKTNKDCNPGFLCG
jgi:hypothetical protein